MLHKIQLCPTTEQDLPFLFQVYASTRIEEIQQTGWSDEDKEKFLNLQFTAQHTHYLKHFPTSNFDIILYKNEKIGRFYVDYGEKDILLIDIALLPQYRKKGIGLYLMQNLLKEAEEKNQPIFLHVEKFNPALNFYHKLGFEIIEDKDVYLYMKWTPKVNELKKENKMSEQLIPITLMSGQNAISIVCDKIKIDWPKDPPKQNMMMVVVDRKTLSVVASECLDNKDLLVVPDSIKKYDGNTEYMLLIATYALNNFQMPDGDFLAFLDKNGSGPGLAKLIQCSSAIMTTYGYYAYCLASTMGTETGYENYKITYGSEGSNSILLPLKLQKIGDYYTLNNVFPQ